MKPLQYKASLEVSRIQPLPKNILLQREFIFLNQENSYTKEGKKPVNLRVSMYVPDVPYGKLEPKIGVTLSIGGRWVRLWFTSPKAIKSLLKEIWGFVDEYKTTLAKALKKAKKDQDRLKALLPFIDAKINIDTKKGQKQGQKRFSADDVEASFTASVLEKKNASTS